MISSVESSAVAGSVRLEKKKRETGQRRQVPSKRKKDLRESDGRASFVLDGREDDLLVRAQDSLTISRNEVSIGDNVERLGERHGISKRSGECRVHERPLSLEELLRSLEAPQASTLLLRATGNVKQESTSDHVGEGGNLGRVIEWRRVKNGAVEERSRRRRREEGLDHLCARGLTRQGHERRVTAEGTDVLLDGFCESRANGVRNEKLTKGENEIAEAHVALDPPRIVFEPSEVTKAILHSHDDHVL